MIRRGYSIMLNASTCYVGSLVMGETPQEVRCPVIYDGPSLEQPILFVFDLQKQEGEGELAGCWMTSAVGGNSYLPRSGRGSLAHLLMVEQAQQQQERRGGDDGGGHGGDAQHTQQQPVVRLKQLFNYSNPVDFEPFHSNPFHGV